MIPHLNRLEGVIHETSMAGGEGDGSKDCAIENPTGSFRPLSIHTRMIPSRARVTREWGLHLHRIIKEKKIIRTLSLPFHSTEPLSLSLSLSFSFVLSFSLSFSIKKIGSSAWLNKREISCDENKATQSIKNTSHRTLHWSSTSRRLQLVGVQEGPKVEFHLEKHTKLEQLGCAHSSIKNSDHLGKTSKFAPT